MHTEPLIKFVMPLNDQIRQNITCVTGYVVTVTSFALCWVVIEVYNLGSYVTSFRFLVGG